MMLVPENEGELISQIREKFLVIYGMGYVGRLIADWCDEKGLAYGYADHLADEKQKETEIEVLAPEMIRSTHPDALVVVASINYHDEICLNLKRLGFQEGEILSCLRFWSKHLSWKELEESANWEEVRQRARIFSAWIPASASSVTDYGYERNFLREFLPAGTEYLSPDYISFQEDGLGTDFTPSSNVVTDAAFGMAILMSFSHPEDVIEHICAFTRKTIVVSYVPWENLPYTQLRRCIHYWNDYTEEQFVLEFEKKDFCLKKKGIDPYDEVNQVYLFEKG